MFPVVERPRITEIQVRIDCNGCVQKINKALHGINGIYDVYIDLPQQKLVIVGWADPEKIIKAIKKARKTATIYSHCEVQDPPPGYPMEQPPPPPPPPDSSNPPAGPHPAGPPPPDQSHPLQPEPPRGQQPPPQHPPCGPNDSHHHHPPRDVEEVHVIHRHPPGPPGYGQGYGPGYNPRPPGHSQGYGPDYNPGPPGHNQGYGPGPPGYNPGPQGPHGHGQGYDPSYNPRSPGHSQGYGPGYNPGPADYRPERPQPGHVVHNYHQHRQPAYVTQYEYVPSPPIYASYARMDNYYYNNGDYQNDNNSNNSGYPTTMFNEENPNACTIC